MPYTPASCFATAAVVRDVGLPTTARYSPPRVISSHSPLPTALRRPALPRPRCRPVRGGGRIAVRRAVRRRDRLGASGLAKELPRGRRRATPDVERDALTVKGDLSKRISLSMTQPAPQLVSYTAVLLTHSGRALGLRSTPGRCSPMSTTPQHNRHTSKSEAARPLRRDRFATPGYRRSSAEG